MAALVDRAVAESKDALTNYIESGMRIRIINVAMDSILECFNFIADNLPAFVRSEEIRRTAIGWYLEARRTLVENKFPPNSYDSMMSGLTEVLDSCPLKTDKE